MGNGFFIVTGSSRGIGEAVAKKLLDDGNIVLGISRKPSGSLTAGSYHHLPFDLTETSRLERIIEKAGEIVHDQRFDFVCLVNNASAVEPIGPIEKCALGDLEVHLQIGLVAPLLLTSLFIGRFTGEKMRKKVVYISSGAAFTPIPGNSVYSTAKAGIHMLAQCVGLEQKDQEGGVEVLSIGPGMVDTDMQEAIRLKTSDEFAMVDFFMQAYEEGRLQDPGDVAEKIYTIIENQYEQGKYVSISEV